MAALKSFLTRGKQKGGRKVTGSKAEAELSKNRGRSVVRLGESREKGKRGESYWKGKEKRLAKK